MSMVKGAQTAVQDSPFVPIESAAAGTVGFSAFDNLIGVTAGTDLGRGNDAVLAEMKEQRRELQAVKELGQARIDQQESHFGFGGTVANQIGGATTSAIQASTGL